MKLVHITVCVVLVVFTVYLTFRENLWDLKGHLISIMMQRSNFPKRIILNPIKQHA